MTILNFPLSKITLSFLLGILFTYYTKPDPEFIFIVLITLFLFLALSFYLAKKDFLQKNFFGILSYLVCFCIGCTTLLLHTDSHQKRHYIHQTENNSSPSLIQLTITEKLKSGTYNQRYIAQIQKIDTVKNTGTVLLNIKKDSLTSLVNLPIGSVLQIIGTIIPHKKPYNPNQFDYGKYLRNKSIFAQIYTDKSEIKISTVSQKDIFYYAAHIRDKIISNLKEKGFNDAELNVVAALILGQQQDISPEIMRDYQYAGAVHILSVSGLHVGFILIFINFILKPIPDNKTGTIIKLILVIICLWLFAVIAGLSPPVVRSAAMFSFVAIGMHLKRHTNIYHTLIISILIILLFQPAFLFDVGFQLSYIALFFIVWFQPLLSKIWLPKNKILKYFWDILTVSFAAQIGALPLSLYYFHQFPGLFFVTNIIIIPFLTIILALGVVVMLLAAFNQVPLFLLKTLEYSIFILNKIISWVASFEDFIIKDIPFNSFLLISSYLVIFSIIMWLKKPNYHKLVFSFSCLILFQFTFLGTKWENEKTEEWIVFNMRKNNLILEKKGTEIVLYSNDKLIKDLPNNLTLKSYLLENFSSVKQQNAIHNLAYFDQKKILIIDHSGIYPTTEADILLIIQSPKINLERIINVIKPKLIIADASNYKSYVASWNTTCQQKEIPFHAVAEKGFYKISK